MPALLFTLTWSHIQESKVSHHPQVHQEQVSCLSSYKDVSSLHGFCCMEPWLLMAKVPISKVKWSQYFYLFYPWITAYPCFVNTIPDPKSTLTTLFWVEPFFAARQWKFSLKGQDQLLTEIVTSHNNHNSASCSTVLSWQQRLCTILKLWKEFCQCIKLSSPKINVPGKV